MILCISVLSVVISPFSFLILLIWFFSLCFFMSLANGLSILFILSKNQLLALLFFAMVSFVSFAFISALTVKISFLLLPWGSSILPFLVALGVSSVQSLSCVWLLATMWTAARQASLSITNSWNLLKFMSVESIQSVMPSNHLIFCHLLLLLPSIFPSIRVFSNESVLHIRWPKYWSFSFNISPSSEYSGLISFRIDWFELLAVQETLQSLLYTTVQKNQFFGTQPSLRSNSHNHTWLLEKP